MAKRFTRSSLLASALLFSRTLTAETHPSWKNQLRLSVLNGLDGFLDWSINEDKRTYPLKDPIRGKIVQIDLPELAVFEKEYGYFSPYHPLIGSVTESPIDISLLSDLLVTVDQRLRDTDKRALVIGELLSKGLAYRNLQVGMEIPIPSAEFREDYSPTPLYVVDKVFDLWHEMPAFGLVPKDPSQGTPLLLYRGTDFSLTTKRSWASVLSDLDIRKVGFAVFENAQAEIHTWLKKVGGARVMGFSLGGTLALYTQIYEYEWIGKGGSFAFNPAGISREAHQKWILLPDEAKKDFTTYVTQGDPASNSGYICGTIYAFCLESPMQPIMAHASLITALPRFRLSPVEHRH